MWTRITLFLLCILVVAGSYYYLQPRRTQEGFANNIGQEYRQSIVQVFNTVLGRDPQEFEVMLYRDTMTNPYATAPIEEKLKGSMEFQKLIESAVKDASTVSTPASASQATVENFKPDIKDSAQADFISEQDIDASLSAGSPTSVELTKRLEIYRTIIRIYEKSLDRLPDMKELNYYMLKLTNETDFNINKLEIILEASEEYRIIQMNQTNRVNGQLDGAVTDAQLTLMVIDVYASIFPGTTPPKELEYFLKRKYVEYKLDTNRLKQVILLLNSIDNNMNIDVTISPNKVTQETTIGNNGIMSPLEMAKLTGVSDDSVMGSLTGGVQMAVTSSAASTVTVVTQAKAQSQAASNANAAHVAPTATYLPQNHDKFPLTMSQMDICQSSPYNKDKFYDSLYSNMKVAATNDAGCFRFGKGNGGSTSAISEKNKLAEVQNQRNLSELKYQCNRNSYYINTNASDVAATSAVSAYDTNAQPQMMNSKFGTFLEDAADTKVGSIMPKFVFKEYI